MLPSRSTLEYASVVKPLGGNHDTGVAAASVSVLNEVTTAQRNGSSQSTASTTRATSAPMRPGLAKRSPMRRSGALGEPAARVVDGRRVVGSVAMAVIRRSCRDVSRTWPTEMMTMRAKKM